MMEHPNKPATAVFWMLEDAWLMLDGLMMPNDRGWSFSMLDAEAEKVATVKSPNPHQGPNTGLAYLCAESLIVGDPIKAFCQHPKGYLVAYHEESRLQVRIELGGIMWGPPTNKETS